MPTAPARHIKVAEGQIAEGKGSDQSLQSELYEGGRLERNGALKVHNNDHVILEDALD